MAYVAWDTRMSTPDEHGTTPRATMRHLTRGGRRPDLLPELEGPPFPDALEYLYLDRFLVLDGMRGESMSGLARFTPEMVQAADELFAWRLTPREAQALRALDVVRRDPTVFDEPSDS